MPVNVGTLVIDLQANTAQFSRSMGEMSEQAKDSANQISSDLKKIGEASLAMIGAVTSVAAAMSGVFAQMTAGAAQVVAATNAVSSSGVSLVNVYRAIRLALAPTPFTVLTLATTALIEKTMELTYARGKLIEQQAVLAAQAGAEYGDAERLTSIAHAANIGADVVRGLQAKAGDRDLTDIAKQFAAIEDPAKRAALAVQIFGSDAQQALDVLNSRFISASENVDEYGVHLDEVSRVQIARFRRETEDLINFFTDFSKERVWFDNMVKGFAILGGVLDDLGNKVADWWEDLSGLSLIFAAFREAPELPKAVPSRVETESRIAAEDLTAQETARRQREAATLEGMRKEQAAKQAEADGDLKRLQGAEKGNIILAQQMQAAQHRADELGRTIKAQEDADAAAKKAAAQAQALADWQLRFNDRLTTIYQGLVERSLKESPLAQEIFRGRIQVTQDADKTTPEQKSGLALLATQSLQQVANEQLKQFGRDWQKSQDELLKAQSKAFQTGLEQQIQADERAVAAMRALQAEIVSHDVAMAQIRGRAGAEAETAKEILNLHLRDIANRRTANDDEETTLKLNTERQRAFDVYEQSLERIAKQRKETALQAGGYYSEQLRSLQEQLETLNHIGASEATAADIAASRKAINEQILDVQIRQTLAMGRAQDGVRAFFLEMQKQAKSPAEIMYEAMNSTIDKLSDNLSNLLTGQKANWAAMFRDIGKQMEQSAIKSILQKGLAALGSKLGINLQKMDGQDPNTALWVQLAGAGPGTAGGLPTIGGIKIPGITGETLSGDFAIPGKAITGALGKLGGFFGKLGSSFSGAFATGGTVEPGSAYLVGERGPELYTPGAPGSIHTADETGRLMTGGPGGGVHYYTIDARGTDPALTEQRTRQAIIAAHQSAIMTSTQVQTEKAQRTPPMVRR